MKKFISLVLLLSCAIQTTKTVVLTHPALKVLDGSSIGLDGVAINGIFVVLREIEAIRIGQAGNLTRLYKCEENLYSVEGLAQLEQRLLLEEKNLCLDIEQLAKIAKKKQNLNIALEKAKTDFIEKVKPFIKGVQKTKSLVVNLLKESCEKRDIMDSIMMKWLSANGNEEYVFKTSVNDCQTYAIFLQQVKDFLLDLVESCPIGYEQFKDLIKQHKKNN